MLLLCRVLHEQPPKGRHGEDGWGRNEMSGGFCWSWREESNPRPADYKSAALPTELRQLSAEQAENYSACPVWGAHHPLSEPTRQVQMTTTPATRRAPNEGDAPPRIPMPSIQGRYHP